MYKIFCLSLIAVLFSTHFLSAQTNKNTEKKKVPLVYKFDIKDEIGPAVWRTTKQGMEEAHQLKADFILIEMNTYGGLLDAADSIRTKILNSQIPVLVFINNNAASAGALISIAADSIYMHSGANIGAATVVNQEGEVVPDKYQSYMRSMMRSTAESHGKRKKVVNGDTIEVWHRDPKIAEAMVDPSIYIENVIDSGKVLTFTTDEALRNAYCEAKAENIQEVLTHAGIKKYELKEYHLTTFEKLMGVLVNPYLQGILIMLIIGGIYFELQSPGIGFALAVSIISAIIYFAPLYLEGLAANWEILIFIGGIILLGVEIFVLPGLGIAGIFGIVLIIAGLTLSMVDEFVFEMGMKGFNVIFSALGVVIVSTVLSFGASILIGKNLIKSNGLLKVLVLDSEQNKEDGFIGVDNSKRSLVGQIGIAYTALRPSGVVEIADLQYDAKSITSFIEKGETVEVVSYESGQLYVRKIKH